MDYRKFFLSIKLLLTFSILFFAKSLRAQDSILNQTIHFGCQEAKFYSFAFEVSDLGKFDFSFNSAQFKAVTITIPEKDYTLKQIFEILEKDYQIKAKSQQKVVTFTIDEKEEKITLPTLSGIVLADDNGRFSPVSGVRISEPQYQIETTTDSEGKFSIICPLPEIVFNLQLESENHLKKKVRIKVTEDQLVTLKILNTPPSLANTKAASPLPVDTIPMLITLRNDSLYFAKYEKEQTQLLNLQTPTFLENTFNWNLDSVSFKSKSVQLGLVPPISTSGDSIYNNYFALNAIAGYNAGIKGLGISGLGNLTQYNSYGVNLSGLVNEVKGKNNGVQIGGLYNRSRMKSSGVHLGGIIDLVGIEQNGLQIGGISAITLGSSLGLQIGGVHTFTSGQVIGMQLSGINNYAKDNVTGMQLAGVVNIAQDTMVGLQLSLVNLSQYIEGVQLGLVNASNRVNGVQLGFINVAGSYEGGVPIGFISFVENGLKRLDFSYNTNEEYAFQFKTGTKSFYNIFGVSYINRPGPDNQWSFTYGAGTHSNYRSKWFWFNELYATEYENVQQLDSPEMNLVFTYKSGLGRDFDFIKIYVAPYISAHFSPNTNNFEVDSKWILYEEPNSYNEFQKLFYGVSIGIQLLN